MTSSRVVEVILSAVRPRELLAGKVIGMLGLGQFAAVALAECVDDQGATFRLWQPAD